MPQCRFCLEDDEEEDQLIAPCACDGSHKFVHAACLAEWRRGRFPGARRRCNVCNAKWTTKPPPRTEREFFARAVKTASRYRPAAHGLADEDALRAILARAGGLIAQAPRRAEAEAEALQGDDAILTWTTDANAAAERARAAEAPAPAPAAVPAAVAGWAAEAGRAVDARRETAEAPAPGGPRSQRGAAGPQRSSLVARFRAALGTGNAVGRAIERVSLGPPSMASLMVAVLRARAQRHWQRGIFLVLYVGRGLAADGSDAIVACGITRHARLVGGEALEDGEVAEAEPSKRLAWLRSAVAAMEPPASSEEEESDSDGEANEPPADVRSARKAVERLRRMGCRVAVFSGGPVHRSEPLGLLIATRGEESRDAPDDAAIRASVGDVVPWQPGRDDKPPESRRSFVGVVPLVARCARIFREAGWALEALVWSGCAVWSTEQLLAEVSRGSWALSPAQWPDASATAESRRLWGEIVVRDSALLPPESAD